MATITILKMERGVAICTINLNNCAIPSENCVIGANNEIYLYDKWSKWFSGVTIEGKGAESGPRGGSRATGGQ